MSKNPTPGRPSASQIKKLRAQYHNGAYSATQELQRVRDRMAADKLFEESQVAKELEKNE